MRYDNNKKVKPMNIYAKIMAIKVEWKVNNKH